MKYLALLLIFYSAHLGYSQRSHQGKTVDSLITLGSDLLFSHTDSSIQYFNSAKALSEKWQDSVGLVKSENFIGLYHSLTGDYAKASELYFHSLEIATRNNLEKDEAIIKNNLGALYFDLNELEKSRVYYEDALEIMLDLKDTIWLSKIYGNVAGVYFMDEKYNESILTLEKSIFYARISERYEAMGGAMANLAMVKIAIGQTESAFESFDEGIYILDSIGDKRGVAITRIEKANTLANSGKLNAANLEYQSALKYAKEVSHTLSIKKAYQGLTQSYQSLGKYEQALISSEELLHFQDSLLLIEKYEIAIDLEEKYQNAQKEQKINFLEEKEVLNNQVVAQQKKVNTYLIVLVIILVLFFAFILYQWTKKKKTNQILASKNKQIEKSLAERELLIREVHHRVKNNLQIVSGMLNIQANSDVDSKTKEALLENRKRVQSMAIVHQKLYQNNDINEVQLKEYLGHLIDEVESQNDHEELIQITYDIQDLSLPIDATIPIGLILTEALSNCYKHAFSNNQEGNINIHFEKTGSSYVLKIQDNGKGFEKGGVNAESFGMKLINSLSKSLSANCSWQNLDGTLFQLTFTHE